MDTHETQQKDTGGNGMNVLLPPASVDVYALNEQTVSEAEKLAQDWRFARVNVNANVGKIDDAIDIYSNAVSPSLVIIETDRIDTGFLHELSMLAGRCKADTAAIIIGPDNDVHLYRRLVSMGVSDYLVSPASTEDLSHVIAQTLLDRIGQLDSRLIAVAGVKGGVGTTTIAEALAVGLSQDLGQKTLLMDFAGGWSSLGVGMGFEPSTTLHDVLRATKGNDQDALSRMFHHVDDNLSILAAGGDTMLDNSVAGDGCDTILDALMQTNPVVVVDLSSAPAPIRKHVLARAHNVLMVTTPMLAPLRLSRGLLQELRALREDAEDIVKLVVNMRGALNGSEVLQQDIPEALDHTPSLTLTYDPKLLGGVQSDMPGLMAHKPGQEFCTNLTNLVLDLLAPSDTAHMPAQQPQKGGLLKMLGIGG